MKTLPKKKIVAKMEKEDEFLEENPISSEKGFFRRQEERLRKLIKPKKVKVPKKKSKTGKK